MLARVVQQSERKEYLFYVKPCKKIRLAKP